MENVQSVERNVRLLAMVRRKFGPLKTLVLIEGMEEGISKVDVPRRKRYGVDNVRTLAAAVADDVDGGAPVHEVFSEGLLGELEGVALDELLEDAGDLLGIIVGQALVTLALALVLVPGTGMTPTPRTLGLPVTRSGRGHDGRDEGRSHGDDSCGAHVDRLVKRMELIVDCW